MAKNLLVINVDIRETRVALIENGIIAELHIERETSKGTLGNIYLGKVSRVLPGMQAAFIDVGLERAAFLHVEDLIRPDDFEAYLAGHRRGTDDERSSTRQEEEPAEGAEEAATAVPAAAASQPGLSAPAPVAARARERAPEPEPEPEAEEEDHEVDIELPTALEVQEAGDATAGTRATDDVADDDDDDVVLIAEGAGAEADDESDVEEAGADGESADDEPMEAAADAESAAGEVAQGGAEPLPSTELVRVPEEDAPTARARGRRGRGRQNAKVRRSGRTADRQPGVVAPAAPAVPVVAAPASSEPQARRDDRAPRQGGERGRRTPDKGRRDGDRDSKGRRDGRDTRASSSRDGKRGSHHEPPRISKSTPIREVVREGQEVLVQISKEPIGTKGARVTSHISLPGRYVVYLPTVDHIGISKRIGSDKERSRLRDAIDAMKPPQGGLIVRTLAEGLTKKQLKSDVGYLVRLWGEVVKKRELGERAPVCLYTELDLVLKTARDLFTDDIEKIVIDSKEEYERLRRFVEIFLPERVDCIELYTGNEPIFDAYGIEDEIQRAQSRKVPLPSGGYLILDQAEALTAIDVNTGRFVGKGSKDLEETILATNLEAVEEIAYQLRFRNIGGLIILDLIDMERLSNREKVRKRMEELLSKDKAKTTLNRISDLGLIEMTRKRTRESLGRIVLEPCFYCDGTGQLQSKQTIAYEILRQLRRERMNLPGYIVTVNAHPAVIDLLKSDERVAVTEAERLFQRRIELSPRKEYHLEQFDLVGR
jgi:ribonuclease G